MQRSIGIGGLFADANIFCLMPFTIHDYKSNFYGFELLHQPTLTGCYQSDDISIGINFSITYCVTI